MNEQLLEKLKKIDSDKGISLETLSEFSQEDLKEILDHLNAIVVAFILEN